MGTLIGFLIAAVTVFGTSAKADRDRLADDRAYVRTLDLPVEDVRAAVRTHYGLQGEYAKIEAMAQLSDQEVSQLYAEIKYVMD